VQFIIDVDFALGPLHFVDAGNAANASKVHDASIFRVEVNSVKECSCMYVCMSWPVRPIGGSVGSGTQSNKDRRQRNIIRMALWRATVGTEKPLTACVPKQVTCPAAHHALHSCGSSSVEGGRGIPFA
jgi:hypothetical protein